MKVPDSPARAGAEVSKIGDDYKKSMVFGNVFEMQKPWAVEAVRCMDEWGVGGWDASDMVWRNPCTTDRVNQWMNQWTSESMNQWINDQWMKGWMDEWMEGWASYLSLLSFTSSLGDLFAEAPLLSAASSLSSYLSWLLLLCATQVFSLHSSYSAFSSLQRVAQWQDIILSKTMFRTAVTCI